MTGGLIAIAHQRIIAIEGECDHSKAPTECELEASLAEVTGKPWAPKRWECPECDRRFAREADLRRHTRNIHYVVRPRNDGNVGGGTEARTETVSDEG